MRGKKVLIIDDDADLLVYMKALLSDAGAEVYAASSGREGLGQLGACQPDLVLLDVVMPAMNGWETCRRIRRVSDAPVIFLTAASQDEDIVRGLDAGAIGYVTKPFSPDVLLARARAAVRGVEPTLAKRRIVSYDDGYLRADLGERQVCVDGQAVRLTSTEYKLFAFLLEHAGQVLTHEQILGRVWGWGYEDSTDYVHVYVSHLRRKLEPDPRRPKYLATVRRVGYRFEPQNPGVQEPVASALSCYN
jgi:two-component system KDP operon response regulator KdpE